MNTPYHCPSCRSALEFWPSAQDDSGEWHCCGCPARYPVVCGIADFRLAADSYISIESDRAKAKGLAERFDTLDLAGLVDHYFAITPEVPPALAARYRVGLLESGPDRAKSLMALADLHTGQQPREAATLEIACGSGPFLPALVERFDRVVAVDIALRWLVVARKRLLEQGIDESVELVCAGAEALPFADDRFDLTIAANALEHVRDAPKVLRELHRTLAPQGAIAFTTPNRFSLGPDPAVGLWGIGLLPRTWQHRVALRLRGAGLERIETRGHAEWRRLLADAGLGRVDFALPEVSQANLAHQGPLGRLLGGLYNATRDWPIVRSLLLRLGPLFQIIARA